MRMRMWCLSLWVCIIIKIPLSPLFCFQFRWIPRLIYWITKRFVSRRCILRFVLQKRQSVCYPDNTNNTIRDVWARQPREVSYCFNATYFSLPFSIHQQRIIQQIFRYIPAWACLVSNGNDKTFNCPLVWGYPPRM